MNRGEARSPLPSTPEQDGGARPRLPDVIYDVAVTANQSTSVEQIYDSALDALIVGVAADRAAVLVKDRDGVMRFRAWRGLSDAYRAVVEGHDPWAAGVEPEPILVPDVVQEPSLAPLLQVVTGEGIAAMAFIPLVHAGALVGKFMIYYDAPHLFTSDELWLAENVASHVAAAVGRQATESELRFKNVLLASQSEATLDGILVVAGDGRIASFNQRFVDMWGIPADVLASHRDEDALAYVVDKLADPRAFLDRVTALYRHPNERSRDEIALEDGRVFDRWSAPLVAEDGAHHGRAWYFRDVTDQKRRQRDLEQSHSRLTTLAGMTAELLAVSLDHDSLLERVADVIALELADFCVIWEVEEDGSIGRAAASAAASIGPDLEASLSSLGEPRPDHPAHEVVRTGRSRLLSGTPDRLADGLADEGDAASTTTGEVRPSIMIVPVMGLDRVLGAITIVAAGSSPRYDEADLLLAEEFAGRVGLVVEQARLHEAERAARVEAEKARAGIAFLLEASALLGASLDYHEGFDRLARLAAAGLCDLCVIDVVEPGGSLARVAAAAAIPAQRHLAEILRRNYPPDPAGPHPAVRVIRTGRPEFSPEVSDVFMRATTRDEQHLAITKELGVVSYMSVPISARGSVLGALTLVATTYSGRRYGPDDLDLAVDLARRAGLVLDTARAYEQKSRLARTLQQSLLPPQIPDIPGLDLAARYIAAHGDIGGDFYDVFSLGDDRWLVAIGDVCGKGAAAAALTSMVRYTLRAVAMQQDSPAQMLAMVNEALIPQVAECEFCTLACAVLEQRDAGALLTIAVGGHPIPLVLRGDGSVERAGLEGTVLGVVPEPELHERRLTLAAGDALVLFTDGALDEPDPRRATAERRLIAALTGAAGGDAQALAVAVEEAAAANQQASHKDDTAILVIRISA